jgi:hypothetical protein
MGSFLSYKITHTLRPATCRIAGNPRHGKRKIIYNPLYMQTIRTYLKNTLFRQWTLWNAAGWAVGLVIGVTTLLLAGTYALMTQSSVPYIGLLLAGALTGAAVGTAQRIVLQQTIENIDQRWVRWSMVGGAVGALPAILASFITRANNLLGFAAVGAIFGAAIAAGQWYILRAQFKASGMRLWIGAYALGGMLCGVTTMSFPHPLLLPVCCSLGTLVMGAATGVAVLRMWGDGGVEG